ncbi:MAG TPA: tetratricopeptide repeat protein, partial [Methylomirabilota bacterium]|nr:tetratricopeptide repeat protein [Methylomirabilota bacterium]
PIQELWPGARVTDPEFLTAGVGVLGVSVIAVVSCRVSPAPLVAWLAYLVCLAPTLPVVSRGLAPLGADRYTYVAGVVWAVLGGGAALALRDRWRTERRPRWMEPAALAAAVLAVGALGVATWRQTWIWRDSNALWVRAVEAWPTSAVAQSGLGQILERKGDLRGAAVRYEMAVRLWPRYAPFRVQWGRVLARQGRLDEGAAQLRRAIALDPGSKTAQVTLEVILGLRGGRAAPGGGD